MKTALQEAEDAEEEAHPKDAKGRDILSPEERAKKEEKERQKAAEVRVSHTPYMWPRVLVSTHRKLLQERSEWNSSLRTSLANLGFSRSPPLAQMT